MMPSEPTGRWTAESERPERPEPAAATGSVPRVSVLMAVRDGRDSVRMAIESIQAQTFADWELVLVDDGSRDGTADVLRVMAATEPRIVILRHAKSRGLPASLNLALTHAQAPLVARLDADDVADPSRLAQQVEFLDANPTVDILGSGAQLVDEMGMLLGVVKPMERHEDLERIRYRTVPVMHPTVMMRRAVLEQLGGYDAGLRRAQDVDLWLRAFRAGFRFHNLPDPLILYRVRRKPSLKSLFYVTLVYVRAARAEKRLTRYGCMALWHLATGLIIKSGLYTPRTLRANS